MSRPVAPPAAPPALTVRYDGSARTFAAGNDVVIGRDLRADVRVAHPLISRAHLVLRFDQGRWIAIDNAVTFTLPTSNRYTTLDRLGGYASSSDTTRAVGRTLCTTGDLVLVGGKRPSPGR